MQRCRKIGFGEVNASVEVGTLFKASAPGEEIHTRVDKGLIPRM